MLMRPAAFLVFAATLLANPVTDSERRTASHDPRWAISRSILDPRENTVPEICGNGFLDWRYRFSKITGEKPRRGNMWYSTDKCPLLFADERSPNRPPRFFLFVRIRGKDTAIICTSDLQKLKRMSLHYGIGVFFFFFLVLIILREMNVSEKKIIFNFSSCQEEIGRFEIMFSNCKLKNLTNIYSLTKILLFEMNYESN